jgi:serine/threonine protein kinase
MVTLTGVTIKGYELREQIGMGGQGAVYRAYQPVVDREVAIKVILPKYASQPAFVRRFETEAQLVARLEQLHIVPLYDYWRDPDGAYLVMRFMRGGNLSGWLKQGPLAPDVALRVLEQVAEALALAHRHNVIHRDIKPGNILLDEDRNAYLTDFGIAKVVTGNTTGDSEQDISGSLQYVAPEQLRSQRVTPQADIYSLGLVLYEMLTGEHAFAGATPSEMVYKHLDTPLPYIHGQHSFSEATSAVIQKATAKAPNDRFADTQQFVTALRECLAIPVPQPVETAPEYPMVETLTDRELEVLQEVAQGLSNRDIANKLFVEINTIKWYNRQIFGKLGVKNRRQAVAVAKRMGLLKGKPHTPTGILDKLVPPAPNPYKGLRPFRQADTPDFFGREALTQHLLDRLSETGEASRFLAVIGPSGSGKSSRVADRVCRIK